MIWFVTGTDTGVGKTVVTAALVVALRAQGRAPYVVKPAQTGVGSDEPGDLDEVRRLAGQVPGHEGVRLRLPLAPGTAARLEGAALPTLNAQRDAVLDVASSHDILVEGAGGVLVQLGADWNLLDLAGSVQNTGAEVGFVVVARAGLGTLNHSALTIEAIRVRALPVLGTVIGSWPPLPDLAMEQNLVDLPLLTGVPLLGRIPEGAEGLAAEAPGWLELPGS